MAITKLMTMTQGSDTIVVRMFDDQATFAPYFLQSSGLGPCIALGAIYKNEGRMIHVPADGKINTFLQQIKNESREIRLYIAGAGLEDELCREDLLLFRQKTLDKIATAGLAKQLRCVQWARGKSTQWLRLNLQENDAIYAEHFDEEPRDRIKYRIVR